MGPERRAAKEAGETFFVTGRPCVRGHVSKRYTLSGQCYDCTLVIKPRKPDAKVGRGHKNLDRLAAHERGDKYYFTGEPCRNGHIAKRFSSNGACLECNLEQNRKALANAAPEKKREWYLNRRTWVQANPDRAVEYGRKWRAENPDRAREHAKNFRDANPGYEGSHNYRVRQATPPWADMAEIRRIYANCPEGMQVDHVIPLRGRIVSGLHVPENLQYLTAQENAAKRNHWPWQPEDAHRRDAAFHLT